MRLSARQIEIFQMAYRLKSTRKAAEALHISQPAISRAIAEIEAQIGVMLFDRSSRKFEPTLSANSLNEAVQRHYHGLDRVVDAARMIADGTTGHLKVATIPAIADVLVARAAGRLMAKHPDLRIDIDVMGERECLTAIKSGNVDCAFISTDPCDARLYCSVIAEITPVLAVPSNHPAAEKTSISAQSLASSSLVMLPPDSPFRRATERVFADASLQISIRAEARTQTALLEFVAQGNGFAIVDPSAAHVGLQPNITQLPFPLKMTWPIRTVIPVSTTDTPVVQLFQAEIADAQDRHATSSAAIY